MYILSPHKYPVYNTAAAGQDISIMLLRQRVKNTFPLNDDYLLDFQNKANNNIQLLFLYIISEGDIVLIILCWRLSNAITFISEFIKVCL
jgi:hypothetical protein